MTDDSNWSPETKASKRKPANDNRQQAVTKVDASTDVSDQLDAMVMSIAQLIGRQIAREEFASRTAANDNREANAAEDD
ncbi:hypothetical protein FG152_17155 [Ochrobactrum sp. XJ1]|nr:hypothetical protein [Ochrobactrum sp. XJ1]